MNLKVEVVSRLLNSSLIMGQKEAIGFQDGLVNV